MLLDAVLERFIAHSPMAVAVRGAFEYALDPTHLDALSVRTVGHRDDRHLLFSTCVDLMATVVCRVKPSVHAAYQADDHLPVNVTAVYARLARVTVCHYPAGRSKWNPVGRRLFSQISVNRAGKPLRSLPLMLGYIRGTTATTGLKVQAHLDEGTYRKGEKFGRADMDGLSLKRHDVCPAWTYTLTPRRTRVVAP